MATSLQGVRTSLYTRLSSDSDLTAAIGADRIFDHVPRDQDFPFVVLEPAREDALPDADSAVLRVTQTVTIYSRGEGMSEASSILEKARNAIEATPLSISGFRLLHSHITQVSEAKGQSAQQRAVTCALTLSLLLEPLAS